jgi:hypothetical protein
MQLQKLFLKFLPYWNHEMKIAIVMNYMMRFEENVCLLKFKNMKNQHFMCPSIKKKN